MQKPALWLATAALCGIPFPSLAHTGGALDADGCHPDHRKGTYHCHRGEAAGYTFPNRAAMQEAVSTGKFPEKTVDEDGFFSKLWPWGKNGPEQAPAGDAPPPAAGSGSASGASVPASGEPAAPMTEPQKRLKVLKGL